MLLCHKKAAGVSRRCTYVKRITESSRDSDRINAVPGAAGGYRQRPGQNRDSRECCVSLTLEMLNQHWVFHIGFVISLKPTLI
jgi:hypothetical protein